MQLLRQATHSALAGCQCLGAAAQPPHSRCSSHQLMQHNSSTKQLQDHLLVLNSCSSNSMRALMLTSSSSSRVSTACSCMWAGAAGLTALQGEQGLCCQALGAQPVLVLVLLCCPHPLHMHPGCRHLLLLLLQGQQ